MDHAAYIGQTLDGKYQIERELGRGGMGTVYLATHLGTERPVALKIVAPEFTERPEFIERFRREARAAGRLRHPNVVDVTDFGFAQTPEGKVAYLVMEYLDGCTLGEVLDEEGKLPIAWSLDILEQVCSAVHEAHEQGVIHRDLKPDNIWLEPNQRGGYTVKVLDFGIAKLEETYDGLGGDIHISAVPMGHTHVGGARGTVAMDPGGQTINSPGVNQTAVRPDERGTMFGPNAVDRSEAGTMLLPAADDDLDAAATRLLTNGEASDSQSEAAYTTSAAPLTRDLTRVGSVLGTPLYMSPEQCRGDRLDPRSDVYSLGVIAYQMLSGSPPFNGEFTRVMEAHRSLPPPPLGEKKVRKKLERVIRSALAKDPDDRPQTAEAFATQLRSRSEGIFGLLRRAGTIYTEHIQKFLLLSVFFHLPAVVLTILLVTLSFLRVSEAVNPTAAGVAIGLVGALYGLIAAFCAYLIVGTITWIVTQSLAVPLRPIRLRPALIEARGKWKRFAGTGLMSTVLTLLFGVVTCGIGFFVLSVLWTLVAPVVMMENLKGKAALKRSKDLVRRSLATATAAVFIMFIIPAIAAGSLSYVVNITAKAVSPRTENAANAEKPAAADAGDRERNIDYSVGRTRRLSLAMGDRGFRSRLTETVLESLVQILLLPIQIVVTSFTAIIVALLYIKTRQAGGEPLRDLLAKFEEADQPRKKWQERVRQRLIQSGRMSRSQEK
jgi:serine/threonine protein kinase